jgi:hypothetical protein
MYAAGLIDSTLRYGLKNRYRYTYIPRSSKGDGRVDGYEIHGDPLDGWPKRWHFYLDQSGVLRGDDTAANENSPSL